jgi:hypothetical protein
LALASTKEFHVDPLTIEYGGVTIITLGAFAALELTTTVPPATRKVRTWARVPIGTCRRYYLAKVDWRLRVRDAAQQAVCEHVMKISELLLVQRGVLDVEQAIEETYKRMIEGMTILNVVASEIERPNEKEANDERTGEALPQGAVDPSGSEDRGGDLGGAAQGSGPTAV